MIPTAGKLHTDLAGAHSKQSPSLAFVEEVSVTGTFDVELGGFGPGRTKEDFANGVQEAVHTSLVACLGEAPAAGGCFVTTARLSGSSSKWRVSVWDNAFVASIIPVRVRLQAQFGTTVGQ